MPISLKEANFRVTKRKSGQQHSNIISDPTTPLLSCFSKDGVPPGYSLPRKENTARF